MLPGDSKEMNKKIKQLADDAGINYQFAMGASADSVTDLQLEEFAEMIVRECAMFSMVITDDHYDVDALYKHFGVEE